MDVIKRDLKNMDFTSEEVQVLANDKAEWRRRMVWPNAAIWMRDELRSKNGKWLPDFIERLKASA